MRGAKQLNPWIGVFAGLLLLGAGNADATLLGLKQVQVSGGSQVDLLFDGKINKKQIQTEFFKDIIQVSLNDTAVYPAKISSINGGNLTKIFAYQYTPKLVRCRFSVKGQAEDYKDRLEVVTNGKILTVRIAQPGNVDRVMSSSAKAIEANQETAVKPQQQKTTEAEERATAKIDDPEQRKLLEKVLKENLAEANATVEKKGQKGEAAKTDAKGKQLTGGKPLPSPFRVFGKLAAIFALIGGIAFVFRKVLKGNPVLTRLAKNGLGKKKMIEVLSNHHLGPKKSIAVVRVAGRTMVLGITDESINLITQLGAEAGESSLNMEISDLEDLGLRINERKMPEPKKAAQQVRNAIEPEAIKLNQVRAAQVEARQAQANAASAILNAASEPDFSVMLSTEARKPAMNSPVNNSALRAPKNDINNSGVRARIKNRLEGLKQL